MVRNFFENFSAERISVRRIQLFRSKNQWISSLQEMNAQRPVAAAENKNTRNFAGILNISKIMRYLNRSSKL